MQDTTALKARLDAALGRRIPLSSGWGSPGEQSDRADSAEASSRESWHSNQRPVCQVYLCRQLLELHQLLQPVCALLGVSGRDSLHCLS